jgi:hypothetical protein
MKGMRNIWIGWVMGILLAGSASAQSLSPVLFERANLTLWREALREVVEEKPKPAGEAQVASAKPAKPAKPEKAKPLPESSPLSVMVERVESLPLPEPGPQGASTQRLGGHLYLFPEALEVALVPDDLPQQGDWAVLALDGRVLLVAPRHPGQDAAELTPREAWMALVRFPTGSAKKLDLRAGDRLEGKVLRPLMPGAEVTPF